MYGSLRGGKEREMEQDLEVEVRKQHRNIKFDVGTRIKYQSGTYYKHEDLSCIGVVIGRHVVRKPRGKGSHVTYTVKCNCGSTLKPQASDMYLADEVLE